MGAMWRSWMFWRLFGIYVLLLLSSLGLLGVVVVERMERSKTPVPIGISNRHVHLDQAHWDILFGKGAQPRKFRAVKQPGFWASAAIVGRELFLRGKRYLYCIAEDAGR